MKPALLTLFLIACADPTVPPDVPPDAPPDAVPDARAFTWRDAEDVWSDAWCQYAERCYPVEFAATYGDRATCVLMVTAGNCATRSDYGLPSCDDTFPDEHRGYLEQCHAEMVEISCSATTAPDICLAAWG